MIWATLYTATLEWKPRPCLDNPLHLATQPNTNTPSKLLNHTTNSYYANTVVSY